MAVKTNERPGTRALLRYCPMSSYKAREVLDLIRGLDYTSAAEVLEFCDRSAATVVAKLLRSAAANAEHNEGLVAEEMYVASAFADEGATQKRWRPRARGRATRIRKRSCHITLVLARMDDDKIARRRARVAAEAAERRARLVQGTRRRAAADAEVTTTASEELAEDLTEDLDMTEPTDAAAETEVGQAADETEADETPEETDAEGEAEDTSEENEAEDEAEDTSEENEAEDEAVAAAPGEGAQAVEDGTPAVDAPNEGASEEDES